MLYSDMKEYILQQIFSAKCNFDQMEWNYRLIHCINWLSDCSIHLILEIFLLSQMFYHALSRKMTPIIMIIYKYIGNNILVFDKRMYFSFYISFRLFLWESFKQWKRYSYWLRRDDIFDITSLDFYVWRIRDRMRSNT